MDEEWTGHRTRPRLAGDETAAVRAHVAWSQLLQNLWLWIEPRRFALLAFGFPVFIRAIAEILAGPWPLGFDTVWAYAPFVKEVQTEGLGPALSTLIGIYHIPPLMFVLLGGAASLSSAEPFTLTKSVAPLLYGFFGFSMFYFARRGLLWDQRKSLVLVLIASLYFLPLRFSWDMYKNTLGLSFFLLTLAHLNPPDTASDNRLLFPFAVLCALSSEVTAALLAATGGVIVVWERVRHSRWDGRAVALTAVGAAASLLYLHVLFPLVPPETPLAPPPIQSGPLFNYVGTAYDTYGFPTLADLYVTVFVLTAVLFAPIVLLAAVGFFRERRLIALSIVSGVGSFSLIVSPFAAIPFWHRWLFMLVLPALFFATAGLLKVRRKYQVAFLAVLLVLAASFIALPPSAAFPYFTSPQTLPYVPSSLLQNTVPLRDSPDVVRVASWVNEQRVPAAVVVANIRFVGWAELYVESAEVFGFIDPVQVNEANFSRYSRVFMIDWAVGEGGFQLDLFPSNAVEVFRSGQIAAYEIQR